MAAGKNKTAENAAQEVQDTSKETEQAATVPDAAAKRYVVRVDNSPSYCGIGAGGIQFANGQAVTESARMAEWFREHKGYTVTEQE